MPRSCCSSDVDVAPTPYRWRWVVPTRLAVRVPRCGSGLGAQRHRRGGGVTGSPVLNRDLVARLLGQGQLLKLNVAGGSLAVDLGDDVLGAQPGLGGGAAG